MGHIAGTTFGIGTPATYFAPGSGGLLSYPGQSFGGFGFGGAQQPTAQIQQIQQLLQILPQQLQQLQALQQQQLLQLQQLLQFVPAQLQQLQQLIQSLPYQIQQLQQQAYGSGISSPAGFGLAPQAFGGPGSGNVM
jgi:hypothetical protein